MLCVLSFVVVTLLLVMSVLRLNYKEDIADFLPVAAVGLLIVVVHVVLRSEITTGSLHPLWNRGKRDADGEMPGNGL